jgi:hypothetical protein
VRTSIETENCFLVIGLAGPAGVGKDTLGDLVASRIQGQKLKFTDVIKRETRDYCLAEFGIDSFTENREEKAVIRPVLVRAGELRRRQDPNYLIKRAVEQVVAGGAFVFADVRYEHEAKAIRELGGVVVALARDGVDYADSEERRTLPQVQPDLALHCEGRKWNEEDVDIIVQMAIRKKEERKCLENVRGLNSGIVSSGSKACRENNGRPFLDNESQLAGFDPDRVLSCKEVEYRTRSSIVPENGGCDEASLHERTLLARWAQTEPARFQEHPVGSFGLDRTGELMRLMEFELKDPRLIFPEGLEGKPRVFVDKYVGWIRQGHMPPPLRGIVTDKGNVKIQDGHHRAASLRIAGINSVKVWVILTDQRRPTQGFTIEQACRLTRQGRTPAVGAHDQHPLDGPLPSVGEALLPVVKPPHRASGIGGR